MKAVILAAGRGTRMKHLVEDRPKPMIEYQGKTLIEHKLEALPSHITDVVIVTGYMGNIITKHFGTTWNDKRLHYVEQTELLGTAHALHTARHLLDEPFIVLMGDDLYNKEDLELLATQPDWAILVEASQEKQSGGKIIVNEHGHLTDIVEDKDGSIPYNFVYTGACVLTPDIFDVEMTQLKNSKEFGLPQTFASVAHLRHISVHQATMWKRITSPEDVAG